jgi:methyltransferase
MDLSRALYIALLCLVAMTRLLELWVSRRHLAKTGEEEGWEPHYRTMVLVHVCLFIVPLLEIFLLSRAYYFPVMIPAFVFFLMATALRIWVIRSLGESWNTRGLVAKELKVVTSGPYHWIRHPNYLAVIIELAVLPLIHGAYLSAVALTIANGLVLSVRIPWEESQLFGFSDYKMAFEYKPRFIPFFHTHKN